MNIKTWVKIVVAILIIAIVAGASVVIRTVNSVKQGHESQQAVNTTTNEELAKVKTVTTTLCQETGVALAKVDKKIVDFETRMATVEKRATETVTAQDAFAEETKKALTTLNTRVETVEVRTTKDRQVVTDVSKKVTAATVAIAKLNKDMAAKKAPTPPTPTKAPVQTPTLAVPSVTPVISIVPVPAPSANPSIPTSAGLASAQNGAKGGSSMSKEEWERIVVQPNVDSPSFRACDARSGKILLEQKGSTVLTQYLPSNWSNDRQAKSVVPATGSYKIYDDTKRVSFRSEAELVIWKRE